MLKFLRGDGAWRLLCLSWWQVEREQSALREGVLEPSFTHGLEKQKGSGGGKKVSLHAPALQVTYAKSIR